LLLEEFGDVFNVEIILKRVVVLILLLVPLLHKLYKHV